MPMVAAAIGMVADRHHRAAGAAAQQVRSQMTKATTAQAKQKKIEPLVLVEGQAEGRPGLVEVDALDAARPISRGLVFQDLRRRDGERESGKRQIKPFEPQRRPAEEEADDQRDEAGNRHRRPIRDARHLGQQDRRGIAADGEESAMAQRDLAVEAGEDVEAQKRDRVDDDQRHLREVEVAERERQDGGGDEEKRERQEPPGAEASSQRRAAPRRGARCRASPWLRPASRASGRTGRTAARSARR